jgi:plasmid stabilization system protein ParE
LLVPSEAVIRTGRRTIVMLAKQDGRYQPAEVRTGREGGGHGALVAEHVHDELLDAMRRLALRPFLLGRPTANPAVRLLPLRRYPYRIYYTVTAVAVVILHIRHSARLDPDLSEIGYLHEDPAVYGAPSGGDTALPR